MPAPAYPHPVPPHFAVRSDLPELMDDPAADPAAVQQALRELKVINTWLGGWNVTLSGLDRLLAHVPAPTGRPLRILEVACGGGDMLVHIARWAQRRNQPVELIGLDRNPLMLKAAAQATQRLPANVTIELVAGDALADLSSLRADIVTHCLFAHHLDGPALPQLLANLHAASRLGTVGNDLHRHPLAWYGFRLASILFGASPMVKYDGTLSVLRSLTRSEWTTALAAASIAHHHLSWHWAWRWQIVTWH